MGDRIVKYLRALSRRKSPMTLKQIESLSSDFDVSESDLERLSEVTRRFINSDFILTSSTRDLCSRIKDIVYGVYHDKETLLLLLVDLGERYRQDKLKLVYDMLMISIAQAQKLGTSVEELSEYTSLSISRLNSNWSRWVIIGWLVIVVLFFAGYQGVQRGWFIWMISYLKNSKRISHIYLNDVTGQIAQESFLMGRVRNLKSTVAIAGFDELPLKVGVSSIIFFPESYLCDFRAGVILPNSWESYHYTFSLKDVSQKEIQSFSGFVESPSEAVWSKGVTLPIEFQHFELGRPKGIPYSLSLTVDEIKISSDFLEGVSKIPLKIKNLSHQNLSLSGNLISAIWKENFGIWQGEFILELLHNYPGKVRGLRVSLQVMDELGNQVASFEESLLEKDHSLMFSKGERRRFILSHDFVRAFVGDLPNRAKTYCLEVLSWQ